MTSLISDAGYWYAVDFDIGTTFYLHRTATPVIEDSMHRDTIDFDVGATSRQRIGAINSAGSDITNSCCFWHIHTT